MMPFFSLRVFMAKSLPSIKIFLHSPFVNLHSSFFNDQYANVNLHSSFFNDQYANRPRDLSIRVTPMANIPVSPMPQEKPARSTGAYCRHMAP